MLLPTRFATVSTHYTAHTTQRTQRTQRIALRARNAMHALTQHNTMRCNTTQHKNSGEVLRREMSALGPVAVKIGQTLSQRPDIIPEDACEALKGLQVS